MGGEQHAASTEQACSSTSTLAVALATLPGNPNQMGLCDPATSAKHLYCLSELAKNHCIIARFTFLKDCELILSFRSKPLSHKGCKMLTLESSAESCNANQYIGLKTRSTLMFLGKLIVSLGKTWDLD